MSQAAHLLRPPAPRASTPHEEEVFRQALIESRQRWRLFGSMALDLAFETDRAGRLTFVAPEEVLGWPAEELLGRPAASFLMDSGLMDTGVDPFTTGVGLHRRPTWFHTRAQGPQCMALSIAPLLDADGQPCGVRAVAVNVTEQERASMASAASLRRAEVLDHIMGHLREEVMAPRMMQALLDGTLGALGATGVATLDLLRTEGEDGSAVLYGAGAPPGPLLPSLLAALPPRDGDEVRLSTLPDGTQLMACPCSSRFGERVALCLWRPADTRAWNTDDVLLLGSLGGVLRMVMEHESIQRELARQARTDPLTGLLNRRAFAEEVGRRLDRLERDGLPGTLLYMDLDRLKTLNDLVGHRAGDEAITIVSALLLRTFRPTDLVARLGGDEFAAWLDGADSFTAAERAESLRLAAPQELAHLVPPQTDMPVPSLSIGIAMRECGSDEDLDHLIQRADKAMYSVKRGGRGHWRVSLMDQAS